MTVDAAVVGPLASVEDALEAAMTRNVSAALLDVNLRGASVDPVADILQKRAIPFAFVTGHSGVSIDAAFGSVPLLVKPVAPDAVRVLLQKILQPADRKLASSAPA